MMRRGSNVEQMVKAQAEIERYVFIVITIQILLEELNIGEW
jgi:hypothetical protein